MTDDAARARPLRAEGAGGAARPRARPLHLLPRRRPRVPAHRSRRHQGGAPGAGPVAAGVHAPGLPDPDPAHGLPGGDADGMRPARRRPRDRRPAGVGRGPGPAPPSVPPRGRAGDGGHRRPVARGQPGGRRRLPAAALHDPADAGDRRHQGAHVQRHLPPVHHLRGGDQPLPGGAVRAARVRRARPGGLPHRDGPGGAAPHRRGAAPRHPPVHRRLGLRGEPRRPPPVPRRPASASTT